MTDHQRSDWLTVEAAAKRLGVSAATIKRRIQDGKPVRTAGGLAIELIPEMIERPQGHEWRVRIGGDLPPISSAHDLADSEEPPATRSDQEPPEALQAAIATLSGALAEERAERQRLTRENIDLGLRLGRAEGDAAAAATRAADLTQNLRAQAETIRAERERREAAEAALAEERAAVARLRARRWWRWW